MSAPITPEDREAAHALLVASFGADYCLPERHDVDCDIVTKHIARVRADAREAERAACEGIAELLRKRSEAERSKFLDLGSDCEYEFWDACGRRTIAEEIRDAIARMGTP